MAKTTQEEMAELRAALADLGHALMEPLRPLLLWMLRFLDRRRK